MSIFPINKRRHEQSTSRPVLVWHAPPKALVAVFMACCTARGETCVFEHLVHRAVQAVIGERINWLLALKWKAVDGGWRPATAVELGDIRRSARIWIAAAVCAKSSAVEKDRALNFLGTIYARRAKGSMTHTRQTAAEQPIQTE